MGASWARTGGGAVSAVAQLHVSGAARVQAAALARGEGEGVLGHIVTASGNPDWWQ